jgi:hypothetical protein
MTVLVPHPAQPSDNAAAYISLFTYKHGFGEVWASIHQVSDKRRE